MICEVYIIYRINASCAGKCGGTDLQTGRGSNEFESNAHAFQRI